MLLEMISRLIAIYIVICCLILISISPIVATWYLATMASPWFLLLFVVSVPISGVLMTGVCYIADTLKVD